MIATTLEVGAGIAAGAAMGFLLGVGIMAAWERLSDPRVGDTAHTYGLTGIPTSRFDDITRARATALLERWLSLSSRPSIRVALVPTTPRQQPVATEAAGWLSTLYQEAGTLHGSGDPAGAPAPGGTTEPAAPADPTTPAGQPSWRRWQRREAPSPPPGPGDTTRLEPLQSGDSEASAPPPPGERLVVVAASSDPDSTPEAEAMRSDVVVLLVETSTRGKQLMENVWALEHFGHRPEWILLIDSPRKSRRAMRRQSSKRAS